MSARATELLGRNLQRLREQAGMSKGELAERAGVHENTIRNIETGKITNPGVENLEEIAKALGRELEDLIFGSVPTTDEIHESWDAFVASKLLPDATAEERDQAIRRGVFRFGPPTPAVWYHAIALLRSGKTET